MLRTVSRGVNTKMQRRKLHNRLGGLAVRGSVTFAGCTDIMAFHNPNPRVLFPLRRLTRIS